MTFRLLSLNVLKVMVENEVIISATAYYSIGNLPDSLVMLLPEAFLTGAVRRPFSIYTEDSQLQWPSQRHEPPNLL